MPKNIPLSPAPADDRAQPTRAAAVGLLALDAVLVAISLSVRWESWFVFAYVPLLITFAIGVINSGLAKWALLCLGLVVPISLGGVGIALASGPNHFHRLDVALQFAMYDLGCAGAVCTAIAVWGWIRFFRLSRRIS